MTMRGTAADHIEHWKQVAGRDGNGSTCSNVRCETWREIVTSGSDARRPLRPSLIKYRGSRGTRYAQKSRAELKRKQHGWTNGRLTADIYEGSERIAALEAWRCGHTLTPAITRMRILHRG